MMRIKSCCSLSVHLSLAATLTFLGTSAALATPAPAAPDDLAAPPATATTTDTGLVYDILVKGTGTIQPGPEDLVKVHYTGWLENGEVFDSSIPRGKPMLLPVELLIPGWQEGLMGMVEGEVRRLWIPEALAYRGEEGKPAGTLVFDVELLGLLDVPKPPADVAAPPADAETSKSGLAWKVLEEGTGTKHPGRKSKVQVVYTGWTTDGRQFDSSIPQGGPALLPLDGVIKGWTEGIQLMVEGERRRFWIPEKLAYKGKKGRPEGMLVFDVELVKILP